MKTIVIIALMPLFFLLDQAAASDKKKTFYFGSGRELISEKACNNRAVDFAYRAESETVKLLSIKDRYSDTLSSYFFTILYQISGRDNVEVKITCDTFASTRLKLTSNGRKCVELYKVTDRGWGILFKIKTTIDSSAAFNMHDFLIQKYRQVYNPITLKRRC